MKLTKKLLAVVLAALIVLTLAACGNNNTQDQTTTTVAGAAPTAADYEGDPINVAAIKGPTGMGMAAMMDNKNYNFTLTGDPTEVATLLATAIQNAIPSSWTKAGYWPCLPWKQTMWMPCWCMKPPSARSQAISSSSS